jgi:hypothetical protein
MHRNSAPRDTGGREYPKVGYSLDGLITLELLNGGDDNGPDPVPRMSEGDPRSNQCVPTLWGTATRREHGRPPDPRRSCGVDIPSTTGHTVSPCRLSFPTGWASDVGDTSQANQDRP